MDDEAHSELHDGLTDKSEPEETESPGAFFPNAHHFVVRGGNFTNINPSVPTIPSDFRRLPMGDLDLRAEIYLDHHSSVVYRRGNQASARRMYSPRVRGIDSNMTVALYQGNNAEEEWREDLQRHLWLRHPSFVQIYGTASSSGIHAVVFHDGSCRVLRNARANYRRTIIRLDSCERSTREASRIPFRNC
ncbi:hypothetical protein C8J57DRAFT_1483848, partial [Mycena rebaudengoi]